MGFWVAFFGALRFGVGFVGIGLEVGLGRGLKGLLGGPFFLIIRFLFVDGASIFSMPKASRNFQSHFLHGLYQHHI